MRSEDVEEVRRAFPERPARHRERLEAQGRGEVLYLIAWMGPEPVGHAVVTWPESRSVSEFARREWCVEVRDVFVTPEHRRMGVATRLMAAAEAAALAYGIPKVGLMTGIDEDYAAARSLYAWLGYEDIGRGPFISTAALAGENGERLIFFGVLTYLTKTLI